MGLNKTTKALLLATTAFVSSPVTSIASDLGGRRGRYVKPGYNNEINEKKIEARIGKRRAKIPTSDSNPKPIPGKRVMKEVKQ